MNRRDALFLVPVALASLLVPPQPGYAQTDPFLGVWQLNVAKSKYSPGPPPKSQTMYFWNDAANVRKNTQVTINAAGVPNSVVISHIYDDTSRPVPGAQGYDASAYARIDDHKIRSRYFITGKLLQTATWTISADGKTLTYTAEGVDANGRPVNQVRFYDKQQ